MGSDPGRYPVSSDPSPAVMCPVVAAAVDRNTAVTDDGDRALTYSASSSAAMNETQPADSELTAHPVDSAMVQSVVSERSPPPRGRVSASDTVEGHSVIADETHPVDSELAHSLCKLIGVVHCDVNCSSSSESDCIHLHNPECSSNYAGTVVDAPLNASPALSLHVSPSESEQVPSVHTSQLSQLQGEYPPRAVTRVRGDLSPPCYDGVNPKGLPSDSASPDCQDVRMVYIP